MSEDIKKDMDTATSIAQKWLGESARTASNHLFEEHFNLISKKVVVKGMPGFDSISYEDWARQSEQEFKDKMIVSVSYKGFKLQATNETQIMFKTVEKIVAKDGTQRAHGVEILLGLEDDVWRVTQERILTDDESRHDGLIQEHPIKFS